VLNSSTGIPFHIVTVLWGEEFCRHYCRFTLPNLLWDGNLPAFHNLPRVRFRLFVDPAGAESIQKEPSWAELSRWVQPEIILIRPPEIPEHNYRDLALLHREAIREANLEKAGMFFLAPDLVLGKNSFAFALEKIRHGARLITDAVFRLNRDTFVDAYGDATRSRPNRELVRLAADHLHPVTRSLMIDNPRMSFWPSHLIWPAGKASFLVRSFHISLFYVDPVDKSVLPDSTVDDDYLEKAIPKGTSEFLVPDSDGMVRFELSPVTKTVGNDGRSRPAGFGWISRWAQEHCNPRHCRNVLLASRIHDGTAGDFLEKIKKKTAPLSVLLYLKYTVMHHIKQVSPWKSFRESVIGKRLIPMLQPHRYNWVKKAKCIIRKKKIT